MKYINPNTQEVQKTPRRKLYLGILQVKPLNTKDTKKILKALKKFFKKPYYIKDITVMADSLNTTNERRQQNDIFKELKWKKTLLIQSYIPSKTILQIKGEVKTSSVCKA